MADADHLIPRLFRAVEDVIRESTEVISDVERRGDRLLPPQVARNSQPTYFCGVYTRSRVYGQDCFECSLQGLGDIYPKNLGQSDSP